MILAQSCGVSLSCGGATCFALGLEFLEEEGHSHGRHAGHSETPCQTVDTGRGSPSLRLWRAPQSHGTLSLLFEFHGGCFGAECGDFPPRADWWHHAHSGRTGVLENGVPFPDSQSRQPRPADGVQSHIAGGWGGN